MSILQTALDFVEFNLHKSDWMALRALFWIMVFIGFMKAYNFARAIFKGIFRNFIRGVPKNLA